MKRLKLIAEWRMFARFWSVRFSALGAALMGFFTMWPESSLYLWQMMPAEIRQFIPERVATGLAMFIFAVSMVSRVIKQERKGKPNEPADE